VEMDSIELSLRKTPGEAKHLGLVWPSFRRESRGSLTSLDQVACTLHVQASNNHQVRTTCKSLDVKQVDELRMSIFHDAKFSTVIPVLHSELSKVSKFALSCLQGLDRPRWKDLGSLKMGYQEVILVNC